MRDDVEEESIMGLRETVLALLTILCIICSTPCFMAQFVDVGVGSTEDSWDYMVFAQTWPETVCIHGNLTHEYECHIAANITTWTVHGLWPTKNGTMGPNYCNHTETFDPHKVEPLMSQLAKYWPNLHTDSPLNDFWKHEWEKHGTCATGLPSMEGEYNYFSTGLKQNRQHDIFSSLKSQSVIPTTKSYNYTDFVSRLEAGVGGKIIISCFYDKKTKTQYIEQIELCLDKNFNVFDCYHKGTGVGCQQTMNITYPPIQHP